MGDNKSEEISFVTASAFKWLRFFNHSLIIQKFFFGEIVIHATEDAKDGLSLTVSPITVKNN